MDIYLENTLSFPREAKTVLSLSTQLINFGSNVNFAVINGHLPISLVNKKMNIKSYTTAAKAVIGSLSNKTDCSNCDIGIKLLRKLTSVRLSITILSSIFMLFT